ncbi:unnamed protein product, partial [Musa hybrid cultivar]
RKCPLLCYAIIADSYCSALHPSSLPPTLFGKRLLRCIYDRGDTLFLLNLV